jgi:hypothetical protein
MDDANWGELGVDDNDTEQQLSAVVDFRRLPISQIRRASFGPFAVRQVSEQKIRLLPYHLIGPRCHNGLSSWAGRREA